MRSITLAVLSSSALLLSVLGSFSYGEPVKQPSIFFSLPYPCSNELSDKTQALEFCLADSFRAGLSVVLVRKKSNCSAKTAKTFTDEYIGYEFKATQLATSGRMFRRRGQKGVPYAVVGVDASAVRVVEPKTDKSPYLKTLN